MASGAVLSGSFGLWPSGTNHSILPLVLGCLLSFLRRLKHPSFIDVVTVRHMAPTPREPDSTKICPTTAHSKLFRWRPTCDALVAYQPEPRSQYLPGIRNPPGGPLPKGQGLYTTDLDYRLMLRRAPDPGTRRRCHVALFPVLYSRRSSNLRPSSTETGPVSPEGGGFRGSFEGV